MTNEEAKKILLKMGLSVSEDELERHSYDSEGYGAIRVKGYYASLNFEFDDDDLKAILTWMNDPKGVTNAIVPDQ